MPVSMTAMLKARSDSLVIGMLCLTCLVLGTFSVEIYGGWLKNHEIHLVNYVAEVGMDVDILSPITPAPIGMQWFSLNFDGELRRPVGREDDRVGPNKSEKFMETYNTSWQRVFVFDELNRWLKIRKVRLGYADLFQVFIGQNRTGETKEGSSAEVQAFDVAITLVTFEKHECGFASKPQHPKKNDTLILSCSVIVNGMWNASLTFRNEYDDTDISGETKTCGVPRKLGSKICHSITIKADADILSYSCQLKFPSTKRHVPKNPIFRNSKWTAAFNKEVVCNLPKIYLQVVPSEVTLLCNNMPCGESVAVGDAVTCVAHGYPQPVFDLRIRDVSPETGNRSRSHGVGYENRFFMDTDETEKDDHSDGNNTEYATEMEIKGFEDFRIGPLNVGLMEITCNVSNALGWGYNSLSLEVKLKHREGLAVDVALGRIDAAAVHGSSFKPAQDASVSVDILCGEYGVCLDGMYVIVYTSITIRYNNADLGGTNVRCQMWMNGKETGFTATYGKGIFGHCDHPLNDQQIGKKLIRVLLNSKYGIVDRQFTLIVLSVSFKRMDILCNGWPCSENKVVNVGDIISFYVDHRMYTPNSFWIANLPGFTDDIHFGTKYYILTEEDIGRKLIKMEQRKGDEHAVYQLQVIVIAVSDFGSDFNLLCNRWPCLEDGIMKVGDRISIYKKTSIIGSWSVNLPNQSLPLTIETWNYTLATTDVGRMKIQLTHKAYPTDVVHTRHIIVISDSDFNILCNQWPCLEDGVMKVGDKISIYKKTSIIGSWSVNLPNQSLPLTTETWDYTLATTDVGRMKIQLTHKSDTTDVVHTRHIIVISDPLVGVDILCNGTFCQDNETMRFGDEISCYFQPKVMLDVMNFTLLIDDYVKVEGYPCTYAMREEDVGTKVVQCKAGGSTLTFESTRHIRVSCEFRDAFVVRRAMPDSENTAYDVIFSRSNDSHYFGAIILCGDEPCDKPGRTIYTGTYISCRMNDGREAYLTLTVNGAWINANLRPILKEIHYMFQYRDVYKMVPTEVHNQTTGDKDLLEFSKAIGPITATCKAKGTVGNHTSNVTVNFTVYDWPCKPDVKPASANIFADHGDAAGAIDVDQAQNQDSGPAADKKGAPKRNEGNPITEVDSPSIGSGRESFVLLQVFLAFVAAYFDLGQL